MNRLVTVLLLTVPTLCQAQQKPQEPNFFEWNPPNLVASTKTTADLKEVLQNMELSLASSIGALDEFNREKNLQAELFKHIQAPAHTRAGVIQSLLASKGLEPEKDTSDKATRKLITDRLTKVRELTNTLDQDIAKGVNFKTNKVDHAALTKSVEKLRKALKEAIQAEKSPSPERKAHLDKLVKLMDNKD